MSWNCHLNVGCYSVNMTSNTRKPLTLVEKLKDSTNCASEFGISLVIVNRIYKQKRKLEDLRRAKRLYRHQTDL